MGTKTVTALTSDRPGHEIGMAGLIRRPAYPEDGRGVARN
jgi:hypothetical protein